MISFKHSFLFASILMVILCQINVLASNSGPQRNRRQQRVNRNDQRRTVEDLINGLRAVVPSSSRTTESLLDDTNNYIRNLQHQVNTLSDRFGNLTDEEVILTIRFF
ncbi:hypothetical protein Mgra_00003783 [Meloidogyne graminicola]|uniref:BHLH domain-containing protein n=1 Tax=Meloidogyne graminicola TaxID=189291 RepID=A0A8S9ZTF3_9BILA|nr:hypothetical protein Mgra_00003783 [Meloidogyne graminicola]